MAISAQRITVSTTAVALNAADTDGVYGSKLVVKNTSANAADLGSAAVTAGAGFDLAAGATVTLELANGELVYAIRTGAADATVTVLRIGV